MAPGLEVEPQALQETGAKLKGLGDQAGGLLGKAATAVVHPKAWGVVGMATLYAGYSSSLPPLHEHLHTVQTTLGTAGDKLTQAAEAYTESDKALGEEFGKVGSQLSGGQGGTR